MRGTTIELLWSHGIVCPLVRRSSRCTWGFYVAWKAGLHHKALFPHSTPERQSLFESHRQRRWLTHWSYLEHGNSGMWHTICPSAGNMSKPLLAASLEHRPALRITMSLIVPPRHHPSQHRAPVVVRRL